MIIPSAQMPLPSPKHLGHCHEKCRANWDKWGSLKVQYVCDCDKPCSTAKKGHTTYTYENMDFRRFLELQRDSEEWTALYKIRTAINHLKIKMYIAGRKSCHQAAAKHMFFLQALPANTQQSLPTG